MSDREKAFFLYGVGVGMKCFQRTEAAFDMIAGWFLSDDDFIPLMEQAKREVDPVFRSNGATTISGVPFEGDKPQ
jgi:hypothetical protein